MPASACSEILCLQSLTDDAISPERRRQREAHLETCPTCQERLERAAAENEAPLAMALQEGDPTTRPADPTLSQLLTRLRNDDFPDVASSSAPLDLGFLAPATRPELLGTLGDYEITEVLGRGATGIVLRAFDPALRRTVAIKVLAPAVAADPIARQRFTREARAAAAISHDNVVSVFAVHESERVPYFAMQCVSGMSLQERLDRTGCLPATAILRIGAQVAHGLAAAHAQGLVHRDIKPANILLEGDAQTEPIPIDSIKAKLTDFGLARTTDDLQLTQDGIAAGTPQYMAPEQARAEQVDARSDLFSLGSVLYAMCTGAAPFRGPSAVAVLRQVSDDRPAPLRAKCPDVPDRLAAIIERLMTKDPDARIQTAAEVANLLDRLATGAGSADMMAIGRKAAPAAPRRSGWLSGRRILTASLVILAIGVGFGSWSLSPEGARDISPEKKARTKATFDFRNGLEKYPALTTNGPDVENIFKIEPNGLRVTLPAGRDDTRPVRIEFAERVRGDFEIVFDGELLSAGTPLPRYGAGIALNVLLDSPNSGVISIYRKQQGDSFGAHKLVMGPDEKNKYVDNAGLKARRPSGKLRVVRTGAVLQYFAAEEGGEYQRLLSAEIGTADVTMVRLECSTMYDPVALEVRLRSLTIEAADLPAVLVAAPPSDASPPANPTESPHQPPSRLRLFIAVAVVALLLAGAAVAFLFLRRRAKIAAPALDLISFKCTRCGRGLKGKASHRGRKVKCPGCGEITPVSPSPNGRQQVSKAAEKP
jgi:serine/threonine protein kinase